MYVCSLITKKWEERLSPNFQGSSSVLQGWFQAQKNESRAQWPNSWRFLFFARPIGHAPVHGSIDWAPDRLGAHRQAQADSAQTQ